MSRALWFPLLSNCNVSISRSFGFPSNPMVTSESRALLVFLAVWLLRLYLAHFWEFLFIRLLRWHLAHFRFFFLWLYCYVIIMHIFVFFSFPIVTLVSRALLVFPDFPRLRQYLAHFWFSLLYDRYVSV